MYGDFRKSGAGRHKCRKQCQLHPSNGYTNSSVEYLTLWGKRITELAGADLLAR
jgi:hypothetical protein